MNFEVDKIWLWRSLKLKKCEVEEIWIWRSFKLNKFEVEEIWSWNVEVEGLNTKINNFTFDKKIYFWPESTIPDGRSYYD